MEDTEIPLRITVVGPPPGIVFGMQQGRSGLHQVIRSSGASISFDFPVRVRRTDTTDRLNFLGSFTQGTPSARFVYVNSGTYAGDSGSCWSRRAKVPLNGIRPDLVDALGQVSDACLEGKVFGSARDGGPFCAAVRLIEPGWQIVALQTQESRSSIVHSGTKAI
jgi:hypothetical protein